MGTTVEKGDHNVLFLVLIILLSLAMVFIVVGIAIKKLQARRTKEVLEKFKSKTILDIKPSANFFGQESLGYTQIRGNGVLILTEDELYFEMWTPKRAFRIPISSIQTIDTPRTHLGKTKGHRLIKVTYQNEKGEIDSMAWLVKDLDIYKKSLEEIINA